MVMRGGLLGVDVLAGAHGQDRGQRVPAVAGGDQHGVDVGALGQELADVGVHLAVVVAVLRSSTYLLTASRLLLLQVADGHELHVGLAHHPLQVAHAAAADADAAADDLLAGRHGAVPAQHGSAGMIAGRARTAPAWAADFRNSRRVASFSACWVSPRAVAFPRGTVRAGSHDRNNAAGCLRIRLCRPAAARCNPV